MRLCRLVIAVAVVVTAACGGPSSSTGGSTPPAGSAPSAPTTAPAEQNAGRSSGPASASAEDELPPEQQPQVPSAALAAWTGDFDGMIERRVIRVLTTYSKVNYFVDRGVQRGLVHDAFRLFEEDLNRDLGRKNVRVHVIFIPVAHDELIPALVAGRGDIVAAGTLLTEWRTAQVDATNPTRRNVSSIIVSGPGVPAVPNTEALGGRDVYLRLSDVSKQGIASFNAKLKAAGKPPVNVLAAPEVLADEDILEMVNAGLVPMTLADDHVAEFWQQVFPGLVLNRGAVVRSGLTTGMLVRKNSPKLLGALNAFLAKYPEGSKERNLLLREYLKGLKHVKNAASPDEYARLQRIAALFRKYGDQYQLDYLLMAAQGYQESQLRQEAKSHVGAIGVMQVMPATGKELGVGDITQLEPNIHAGVKYVRQLRDRQFSKEPMDELNKTLFTFAAYNAGPARVRGLRERAAKRGLNKNLWFNNVEVVAAEAIGRETVQYVANIYKYYLAYTLLSEQRDRRDRARDALKTKPS